MAKTGEQLVTEHYRAMSERAVRRARIAALSRSATQQAIENYREYKARLEEEKKEGR